MLIVDNFAGGGGASSGIEAALGRPIDYAINHDPEAVAMHRANHPSTVHYTTSVWDVDPVRLARGRNVGLGWFSPDCTFHSKARGGKPFRDRDLARRRRGLAWLINRWAKTSAAPNVIMLENVEEFADWGPLLPDGKIDPLKRGLTFRRWHRELENLGYSIDMRELRACDYGAPTTRKRLFIIMRRDGGEIVFPEASHGPGRTPYRAAAECIDWSIPCPSIFTRERPLAEATMRRIARGVMRYVVNDPLPFIVGLAHGEHKERAGARSHGVDEPVRTIHAGGGNFALVEPFILPITHSGSDRAHSIAEPLRTITTAHRGEFALIAPTLINTRNGEREGQAPRVRDIREPWATVTAQGSQGALVAAFIARHYGGHENDGAPVLRPLHTITTVDHHALVHAFLVKFYGNEREGISARDPLHTITTKDRFGLVTVHGEHYRIVDIGMRMLTPRELYLAQGFRSDYIIDHGIGENGDVLPLTKTAQVRMCGNSVSPSAAEALVRANVVEQAEERAA